MTVHLERRTNGWAVVTSTGVKMFTAYGVGSKYRALAYIRRLGTVRT